MNKVVKEMNYALETGWDRNTALRHGIAEIERLEKEVENLKAVKSDIEKCDDYNFD